VRLRLTRPVRLHFLHGGVLHGLLCQALGHELPRGLVPFAPESGRVRFEAGDSYRFGLTLPAALAGALGGFEEGLRRVGRSGSRPADGRPERERARTGPPVALGGNFEVESVETVAALDRAGLERAREALLAQAERPEGLTLRWLSPFRLERPPAFRAPGAGYLNGDCFPAALFLERLALRLGQLATGTFPGRNGLPALPPGLHLEPELLTWVDLPLLGRPEARPRGPKPGDARRGRMTLGGVLGAVRLQGLRGAEARPWAELLTLGRFLHAGQSTGYGLGRYALEGVLPAHGEPFRPARSLLEGASSPERLEAALDHLLTNRLDGRPASAPDPDEDSPASDWDAPGPWETEAGDDEGLRALGEALRSGQYRPPPLEGWLLPREGGKVRPLAVPPLRDRAVQRAAALALAPGIDMLLEDCSYAYRKGFSRAGAARAIQQAYDEGFRVVLDADIAAFFDSVDLERLLAKLRALYPLEPLVALVERWLRAPVRFRGQLLERSRGLPQGAPISPLLANLFLDELDEEILGQGFRLVRFADDFVVLCRSREEAERAREATRAALEELGLSLHEGKTAIRHLDEGLTYLGYLFVRSMAIERQREPATEEAGAPPPPLEPGSVPAASWLAQVPLARLRELVATPETPSGRPRRVQAVPLAGPEHALAPARRALYLLRWDAQVRVSGGQLRVEVPEHEALELPLAGLSHLVVVGRSRATLPALLALAEHGVPTYFTTPGGQLRAHLAPALPDWTLWQAQAAAAAKAELVLGFAREIVSAKLGNSAVLATRFKLQGYGAIADELRELAQGALNKTELDALRGVEGRGAAQFFQALAASLPEAWGFAGRKSQPPPDPINALLSFGYTLLHHHAATALTAVGLNPQLGLLHRPHGRHLALASDLQEELRHVVDSLVLALVRRREIGPEDFTRTKDGTWPVLLSREGRKRFVERFEERFSVLFTPEEGGERMTYWQFLAQQAGQLRRLVRGELTLYRPLRIRE
jgi:group II intron reverse transcriptase/maturase/CRISPR-associated endonuclease Cas1